MSCQRCFAHVNGAGQKRGIHRWGCLGRSAIGTGRIRGRSGVSVSGNGPAAILSVSASRYGDKTALVTTTESLTYAELDSRSDRLAGALHREGVLPGDRVSLYAENRWEWVVAYHGILKAGAVVNPLNALLTPREVAYIVNDCAAAGLVGSAAKVASVLELAGEMPSLRLVISMDEPAPASTVAFSSLIKAGLDRPAVQVAVADLSTIAYTSGTTGHPKGAMQSQQSVLLNCALTATMHVRTSADTVVTALPAPHVYGNVVINSTFMAGGTVVLQERFEPAATLRLIEQHRATMFEGVPAMYAMLLTEPSLATADLSSLTRCTVGGQTIPGSTVAAWEARSGAPLIELWGMTEIAGLGTTHALYAPKVAGSIGVALPGLEVRVATFDDPTQDAPVGEAGELMVRGPLVMLGYYGNPDATAGAIEPDGWLHTGDVALSDDTGHFFVVDRRKDMILTGGYNVYPAEIERVVASHPAVGLVAVGRQPDEVKGELARAYVVLRPGTAATEAEIIDHCRAELAAYKLPRSVRFVGDLPRTSTGKIMRRALSSLD
jgi:long-chain acyl-CoA synthetase